MARNILYELLAKFSADTSGLEKAMSKAERVVVGFGRIAATTAVAAAGALAVMSVHQAKIIDQNVDLSRSLGITYTSLQNISLVAKEAGVELGSLTGVLGIMQRNIFAAARGEGNQRSALEILGVNIKELQNLRPDEQFARLAEAISKVENPTKRAGLAAQIFGRNAREILPVLEGYSEKLKEAAEFNSRFGLSLSDVDAAKIDEMNDAIGRAKLAFAGFANTLLVAAAPALQKSAEHFTDLFLRIKEGAQKLPKWLNSIASPITNLQRKIVGMEPIDPNSLQALYNTRPYDPNVFQGLDKKPPAPTDLDDLFGENSAKEAKDNLDDLREAWLEQQRLVEQFRSDAARAFSSFAGSVMRGENALDSFRNKIFDVAESVIDSMFMMSFGGSSGGGLAGTIAESIFGAFGIGNSYNPAKAPPPRKPFAKGGAFLNSTTMFPMSTGIGMAGEAGAEAIMPLVRGKGGKLGVTASGGGTVINNEYNFALGVQQTVRQEIMRMMPQIQAAGVEGTQNALNRGGLKIA